MRNHLKGELCFGSVFKNLYVTIKPEIMVLFPSIYELYKLRTVRDSYFNNLISNETERRGVLG